MALLNQPGVEAEEIVRRSMKIAGDICVYTNHSLLIEKLEPVKPLICASSDGNSGGGGGNSVNEVKPVV